MSRSGYVDAEECAIPIGLYRLHVLNATRGKRGQKFFADLLDALDSMPEKRLIKNDLVANSGEVCAIGALGLKRGVDMKNIDPEHTDVVAATFDIAECLAAEVVYMNDECDMWWKYLGQRETPEQCWVRMRAWVVSQITNSRRVAS